MHHPERKLRSFALEQVGHYCQPYRPTAKRWPAEPAASWRRPERKLRPCTRTDKVEERARYASRRHWSWSCRWWPLSQTCQALTPAQAVQAFAMQAIRHGLAPERQASFQGRAPNDEGDDDDDEPGKWKRAEDLLAGLLA